MLCMVQINATKASTVSNETSKAVLHNHIFNEQEKNPTNFTTEEINHLFQHRAFQHIYICIHKCFVPVNSTPRYITCIYFQNRIHFNIINLQNMWSMPGFTSAIQECSNYIGKDKWYSHPNFRENKQNKHNLNSS